MASASALISFTALQRSKMLQSSLSFFVLIVAISRSQMLSRVSVKSMRLSIRFSLSSIAVMELKTFGIADVFASIVVNFCNTVCYVSLGIEVVGVSWILSTFVVGLSVMSTSCTSCVSKASIGVSGRCVSSLSCFVGVLSVWT